MHAMLSLMHVSLIHLLHQTVNCMGFVIIASLPSPRVLYLSDSCWQESELRRADEVNYLACEELLIVDRPPSRT